MEKYEIVFSKSSLKELHKIDRPDIRSILDKIEQLAIDPRPNGAMKLKGSKKALWRIRIGNFRVIYSIEDIVRIVQILAIGDRKDIY